MKKIAGVIASICVALVVVGCSSLPPASEGMAGARRSAPENAVVGQATGSSASEAEANAKFQIRRAMSAMMREMVEAAVTDGKMAPSVAEEFRLDVNTALTRNNLSNAARLGSGEGSGKVFWAVFCIEKAEVLRAINSAVLASKEVHPEAAVFTLDGFDAAYRNQVDREWRN